MFDYKFERVDLPIKRSTASRKTNTLGEVHYLAQAGAKALTTELSEHHILINKPTYVVLVDQYAVDITDLTPKQRKAVRKNLENAEINESLVRTGFLKMAVITEENDDAEQDTLF